MADYASLPLYTDAFLADCGHLSDAERGRYLLLLMIMWRSPHCRVPNDKEWLARRFNRTPEAVEAEVMPLIREFCLTTGNWITQKRLKKEFDYVTRKTKKQSDNAKSRWEKEKFYADAYANAMPPDDSWHDVGNAPSPSPSPSPSSKTKTIKFDAWWAAYPRRVGKGAAERAYRSALKKTDHETLLAGAHDAARKFSATAPEFIPHPATWLNGERWLDEAPAPPAQAKRKPAEFN